MTKLTKICEGCGEPYVVCPNCQPRGVYQWRMHYCSHKCFFLGENREKEVSNKLRVEYNKKTWTLKSYDLSKGTYTLPNDEVLKVSDVSSFIMSAEEFENVVNHVPKVASAPKPKTKKATTKPTETEAE